MIPGKLVYDCHISKLPRSTQRMLRRKKRVYQSLSCQDMICAMVKSRVLLGMVVFPPFNRNPYNGYINPYYWVDEFIPYYMEIMGV